MKSLKTASAILLIFIGLNAVVAGLCFIIEPSGKIMQMNVELLKYSLFSDFLVPGIVLFSLLGLWSISVAFFTIFERGKYSQLITLQGILYMGWIAVQAIMLQSFNFLHAIVFIFGLIIFLLGLQLTGIIRENQL